MDIINIHSCTLFTKVLNDRLNVWAEKCHVYIEAQ